eukprot:6459034-Amphidinium_carterae.1
MYQVALRSGVSLERTSKALHFSRTPEQASSSQFINALLSDCYCYDYNYYYFHTSSSSSSSSACSPEE